MRIGSKEKCTNCTKLPGKMIRNDKFFEFVKACKLLAGLENKTKEIIIPYPKLEITQARGEQ